MGARGEGAGGGVRIGLVVGGGGSRGVSTAARYPADPRTQKRLGRREGLFPTVCLKVVGIRAKEVDDWIYHAARRVAGVWRKEARASNSARYMGNREADLGSAAASYGDPNVVGRNKLIKVPAAGSVYVGARPNEAQTGPTGSFQATQ